MKRSRGWYVWMCIAVTALPCSTLPGQSAEFDRDAVVAALRHVRRDLATAALYGRQYEVELARGRDGTCAVVSSAMVSQT